LRTDKVVFGTIAVEEVLYRLVLAPVEHPELLPSLLPLIFGAVIIELYFGKHTTEELGWNSSVGNAAIWATTGINLIITSSLGAKERFASYFLVGVGGLIGYMNFYHKWSDSIAFIISSSGLVYSMAYVTVVVVKTSLPVNDTVLKASVIFIIGTNVVFKLIQGFEKPAQDNFGLA